MSSSDQESAATLPVKRGRGRPKGSRNKPKEVVSGGKENAPVAKKPRITTKTPKAPMTKKTVDELLASLGVQNLGKVSRCLKAGILNGAVKLLTPENDPGNKFGLNQVLVTDSCCYECGEDVTCTVRDVLYQPDYGGNGYGDGAPNATLKCEGEDCGGIFVTEICRGVFGYDSGKFFNHCTKCPQFGRCLGDYRECHCSKCGDHFFMTSFGGGCYTCDKKRKRRI